jgi:hypothetical protein
MTSARVACLALCAVTFAGTSAVRATTPGGKKLASDCYLTFEGIEPIEGSRSKVECGDGGACDGDGVADGQCTFPVTVCVFTTGIDGCTPAPVTRLKGRARRFLPNLPPLPASAPTCGEPNMVVVPLRGRGKTKPGKKKMNLRAITDGGRPKKDPDNVKLLCRKGGGPVPGDRRFSLLYFDTQDARGSHFYSSAAPGAAVDDGFDGTILLRAGTPGSDGVATLEVAEDSYFHFNDIGGGTNCTRISAANSAGKIDCDGGTPVDTKLTQDSGGIGPGGLNGSATSSYELGAAGVSGSAYVKVHVEAVTCGGVLGIPMACPGGRPLSAEECAEPGRVDFSKAFVYDLALTTGQATAEITNARQGGTQVISATGSPFDCQNFVGEDLPGVLVIPLTITDINIIGGDAANVAVLDD